MEHKVTDDRVRERDGRELNLAGALRPDAGANSSCSFCCSVSRVSWRSQQRSVWLPGLILVGAFHGPQHRLEVMCPLSYDPSLEMSGFWGIIPTHGGDPGALCLAPTWLEVCGRVTVPGPLTFLSLPPDFLAGPWVVGFLMPVYCGHYFIRPVEL